MVALNQGASLETPPAVVKDIASSWPAGLVGNPSIFPQCPEALFDESNEANNGGNNCPNDTAIGVVIVQFGLKDGFSLLHTVPLFTCCRRRASRRAGSLSEKVPVTFDTAVRTGSDYGVVETSPNLSEVQGLAFAADRHGGDAGRGQPRQGAGDGTASTAAATGRKARRCAARLGSPPAAAVSLRRRRRARGSLQSTVAVDSWREPNNPVRGAIERTDERSGRL